VGDLFVVYDRSKTEADLILDTANKLDNLTFNHLNAKLNPICYLLALLGAHRILHVSRIRVK
jgi:hypothetical protein